jgi:hypothetical protein
VQTRWRLTCLPKVRSSSCDNGAAQTLSLADSFTSAITFSNLPAGVYCIGLSADNPNDPAYSLIFNAPVNRVPEPSSSILVCIGFGGFGLLARWLRQALVQLA